MTLFDFLTLTTQAVVHPSPVGGSAGPSIHVYIYRFPISLCTEGNKLNVIREFSCMSTLFLAVSNTLANFLWTKAVAVSAVLHRYFINMGGKKQEIILLMSLQRNGRRSPAGFVSPGSFALTFLSLLHISSFLKNLCILEKSFFVNSVIHFSNLLSQRPFLPALVCLSSA